MGIYMHAVYFGVRLRCIQGLHSIPTLEPAVSGSEASGAFRPLFTCRGRGPLLCRLRKCKVEVRILSFRSTLRMHSTKRVASENARRGSNKRLGLDERFYILKDLERAFIENLSA
ncbi:hypothetical protein NDU88_010198 [Pleurodeles waltl]|uniref:Uncharacterized protein n=1 Tax=Pleurodeles waltl TaxID=8319 RepID=A0AAV7S0G4_PLEWA|nr:hypothetical protein NDU88_010198 [Pleurodeles waltl]